MLLSIRRAKARAAQLRDALEVGETWDVTDAERAFNFKKRWDDLIAHAPRGNAPALRDAWRADRKESSTFKRLVWLE